MGRHEAWTDDQLDVVLAYVLRAGVVASAVVIACGGFIFLARHGMEKPSYHLFRREPSNLTSIHGIVSEARNLSGPGLIQLGLLFLIATPITRVMFSVIGFISQRDWLYVSLTLAVLGLLSYSLLTG